MNKTMEVTPDEVLDLITYGKKKGFVLGIIATLGVQYLLRNRKDIFGKDPFKN